MSDSFPFGRGNRTYNLDITIENVHIAFRSSSIWRGWTGGREMTTAASERLSALDALRGLAVAGMILVVSPGDWGHAYAQLQHASWNGATLADMVFPTFLFSVGVALGLSFPRSLRSDGSRRRYWIKLLRRTMMLILLGLFVEASYVWAISLGAPYPGGPGLVYLRIPGILQRIGLCYGLAGIVLIASARPGEDGRSYLNPITIVATIATILVGYWLLLDYVPVPGFGAGQLTPAGSLPGFIDRAIFTERHLWPLGSATGARPATYDPEGLLSTLPATVNVLFGALAAWMLRPDPIRALPWLAGVGVLLVLAGLGLDPVLVINKRIWTSSFALLSSGFSMIALAMLIRALRFDLAAVLLMPFRVLGGNAVLAFLISTVFSRLSGFPLLPERGTLVAPQLWGFHHAQAIVTDPTLASFLCAIGVLALTTALIWPLHRRAVHFRI